VLEHKASAHEFNLELSSI
jgi:hypothetical protein